jgi:hypothetical protein
MIISTLNNTLYVISYRVEASCGPPLQALVTEALSDSVIDCIIRIYKQKINIKLTVLVKHKAVTIKYQSNIIKRHSYE